MPPPVLRADDIELQLAEPRQQAFTQDGWIFELKLDGFRLLVERIGGVVRLVLRRGREATAAFPEITQVAAALPGPDFILDGELCIQDEHGKPIFQRLLRRSTVTGARDVAALAAAEPAVYFAFDLLMLDGKDLRGLPLAERKALLSGLVPKDGRVHLLDHVAKEGEALLALVKQQGLEGVMCKRLDAPYRGGRGTAWLKVALTQIGDFAVVGYAEGYGALYLATWNGKELVYAGKVGAGFNPKVAAPVSHQLEGAALEKPPFTGTPPADPEARWCVPSLVVEVRYKNWPAGLAPREPVFLRFRDDKPIEECPPPPWAVAGAPPVVPVGPSFKPRRKEKPLSNPDKVFFPDDGITKAELVAYYRAVAPWLLPYLVDRPLMMTRFPDGIHGKSFFQKAKPPKAPDFLRTVRLHNEDEKKDIDQLVGGDLQTLEWCAAMGTIPLHIPAGRVGSLERADWAVVDFDPKEAPFAHVVTLAQALKAICDRAKLPCFVKTSGQAGLHVLVPLGGQLDHTGARQLADLLSALVVQRCPELATLERVVSKRQGKVYVDTSSNGQGKLIVAPFAVRAVRTAPVSMPLRWDEVVAGLSPRRWTIRDAIARLEQGGDPLAPVLTLAPDLGAALAALSGG